MCCQYSVLMPINCRKVVRSAPIIGFQGLAYTRVHTHTHTSIVPITSGCCTYKDVVYTIQADIWGSFKKRESCPGWVACHVYMYACMYVCMYVCTCIHMYLYPVTMTVGPTMHGYMYLFCMCKLASAIRRYMRVHFVPPDIKS